VIHGERLRQARELAGLTQRELADSAGIAQPRLSTAERRGEPLAAAALAEIAATTGFPVEFFESEPTLLLAGEPVHFRSQASVRVAQTRQARRAGEVIAEQALRMRGAMRSPRLRLADAGPTAASPRPSAALSPALVAARTRAQLGLPPDEPLTDLPLTLERAGVLVLGLPLPAFRKDAFSQWIGDLPFVALLHTEAGDRQAWSTAHELGHLVLHRRVLPRRELEADADEFARHFLLPAHTFGPELPANPTLQHFAMLKRRWGVSIQAMIRTARRLDAIDADRYTSLFRQISARGERLRERAEQAPIKPRAFHKMAEILYGQTPATGLARDAHWTVGFAEQVLARHATAAELPSRRFLSPTPATVTPLYQHRPRTAR
jgi:Zn-dependent peptidase ImmA (M78 family)/transcriptional regulator with XRE-family HTH domain